MICTRSLWVQCDYLIIWVLLGVIDQLLKQCQVHILRCRNLRSSLASERSANPFQRSFHCGVPLVFTFMDFFSILPDFSLGCSGISSSALSSPCPHFSLGPALSISHRIFAVYHTEQEHHRHFQAWCLSVVAILLGH